MKDLSTFKWAEFRAHTVEKIRNATILWDPYWHVEVPDILHPELFEMCVTNWPDLDNIRAVTENRWSGLNENRRYITPNRHDLNGWADFYNNIQNHPDVVDAVWQFHELCIPVDCFTVDSSLWEDYRGYEFGNHVDKSDIGIAWHIYVYTSDGSEGYGTSLNLEDGTTVKTFPFQPNFSYFNRVDSDAWHSIKPVETDVRRSIMTRFNVLRDPIEN